MFARVVRQVPADEVHAIQRGDGDVAAKLCSS